MSNPSPSLSVVIPVVERSGGLAQTAAEYFRVLDGLGRSYEVIYVVDSAEQEALDYIEKTLSQSENVTCIKLSGSYGDSTALSTGLDAAKADELLILPAYSQIDANEIPKVLDGLQQADFVYAERLRKQDSNFNRAQGRVFSFLINRIADIEIRDAGCEVRAMKRVVAEHLNFHGDLHTFLPLLAHRLGFTVEGVSVVQNAIDRTARFRNPSVYLKRLIDVLNVLFLIRFTKKPLRFFGMIGSFLMITGGVVLTYIVFERLFFDVGLASRPALFIGALMAIVGLQILSVGLIGEIITFAHGGKVKEYQVKEIVGPGTVKPTLVRDNSATAGDVHKG